MPPMNRQTTTNALGAILIPSGCFAWRRDGQDHPRKTFPVVNDRLSMADVRLAAPLNVIFDETMGLPS